MTENSTPTTPAAFASRLLRSGHHYKDLKKHIFNPKEIIWICGVIRHKFVSLDITTVPSICKRYNIHQDGLREWLRLYDANLPITSSSRCESESKNPIDKRGLKRIAKWQISENRCPIELRGIIEDELEATVLRRRNRILGRI